MNTILIDEEFGYKMWIAKVSDIELSELIRRWKTMRGLNCLVPVTTIFPTALEIDVDFDIGENVIRAHVHECEDSFFESADGYEIPESNVFFIDGIASDAHKNKEHII
jgi:hypothetical protein